MRRGEWENCQDELKTVNKAVQYESMHGVFCRSL